MRIEKLELIGFKSFADKTSFALHPGITCIVGPNGCGKSNIVDAFRWVLGEQSAKSLRGEKMEEVIFNGSALKKPKGMAEVTMVVSGLNGNVSGNGQGDYTTVTRRLYRSGESEYMINKTPCRLKDIKDIFLDTGLDFRSYSILEQGRIGEIVNSKPLERRFIIEEVAGVMKYKVRKAEALSKLESSRTNLIRIHDIISEVKKQINILDRLAKKAERYQKLSSEMHAIELKIARKEYQDIKDAYTIILAEYSELKEKEVILGGEISDAENRIEARRLILLEQEKALELIQNNFQSLERTISEIERAIAVGKNDIGNLLEYQTKLVAQEEDIIARSTGLSAKCKELRAGSARISDEMESHADLLKEKNEIFKTREDELAERQEEIEDKRRRIFKISEEISALRNEFSKQQATYEALERREALSAREIEDARKILSEIESSINVVESTILGSNNETLFLREKKEVLLQELAAARAKHESMSTELSAAREELASYVSRLESLREIVLDKPSRELIASKADVRLLASLSDVVEVEAEYEKAIESALSERADSFIMESIEDIEHAIYSLKSADVGKTSFIAVASLQPPLSPEMPEGIIGRALQFVKIEKGYEEIAGNLLSSVVIVRDLKAAFSLKDQNRTITFVTTDGVVIEPSGAVILGGGKGIFQRKREIRELEELIVEQRSRIEHFTEELKTMHQTILERDEAVKTAELSIHNLEKELSLSRLTRENYTEEKDRTSRKIAYLVLELEEVSREKESLKAGLGETEQQLRAAEERKVAIDVEAIALQDGIAHRKAEIEEYRAEVTELRLQTASNREKMESIKNEIESSSKLLEDLGQRKDEITGEQAAVRERIHQREEEIKGQEVRLRTFVAEADIVRRDISEKKENIEKENEDLLAVEHGLRSLRQQVAAMTSRSAELDVQRAEHKLRLENLMENVKNIYGLELDSVEVADVSAEEEVRLAELRSKIQEMGPVNLGTLEEYEELRTRYEFMTKQQDDLTRSIAELEEAISKINSTTRKKLRDAFEVLNAKFGEVFVVLFGGGRAELVLTDENNILESGIDIIVQPPGKKLQNIHLLSGGEKALTALAIQFASFLIKPTPLCILDEADAPLDESNTERYSRMLNELSSNTQFIVVTHNRTTMSVAQHLYGITMEEAGVSKVISMQLAEAAV